MNSRTLIVYGTPVAKGRPRHTRNGHTYTPESTRKAENNIRSAYVEEYGSAKVPPDVPVQVTCRFYMPIPKSASKVQRLRMANNEIKPMKKPDVDNLLKLVLDALNGYAYADDKQVIAVSGVKYYADEPFTDIKIMEVDI